MRLGNRNDGQKKRVVGQLRKTQVVTTFGSGAIVDMPDYSVIIGALDYWKTKDPMLHEPNLEKILNVKGFRQPYVSEDTDGYPNRTFLHSDFQLCTFVWLRQVDAILGFWR